MNVTVPAPIPCINIDGNGWIFVAGIVMGFIIAFMFFMTWIRGWSK